MSLWDQRQPGESSKAWTAFIIYRELGPGRSIRAAWRKYAKRKRGEAPGRWEFWSRTYQWVERAAAYDEHLDGQRRAAREKRFLELEERRADYEFHVQDNLEELAGWLRTAVEKHNAAPITDIERNEEKEVTASGSGEIKVVTVKTKVKGIKTSGLARLSDAYRDTMQQAVVGVREKTEGSKPIAAAPKALLPDFLMQALQHAKETKSDGSDSQPGGPERRDAAKPA